MNTKHNTINTNDQGDPSGFYDALIEEHEEQAVLDCGCILDRSVAFETGAVAFTYCPMHDAAADLLELLQRGVRLFGGHMGGPGDHVTSIEVEQRINLIDQYTAAIAKATP